MSLASRNHTECASLVSSLSFSENTRVNPYVSNSLSFCSPMCPQVSHSAVSKSETLQSQANFCEV